MIELEGNFIEFTDESVDGKRAITASYFAQGLRFNCTLREQKDGIKMRGRVSILNMKTGTVMQVVDPKRSALLAANPKADLNIFKEITCNKGLNMTRVKEKFTTAVKMILNEEQDSILEHLKSLDGGALYPTISLLVFENSFLSKEFAKVTPETWEKKKKDLEEICRTLGEKKLNSMKKHDISVVYKKLGAGRTAEAKVKLFGQYLAYSAGVAPTENPCISYLDDVQRKVKRDGAKIAKQTFAPKSLAEDEDVKLNQLIATADPNNSLVTGLLLVKELGLTSAKALDLNWENILWECPEIPFVRVALSNIENAGATHNYTKPCGPFASAELKRRFQWAVEQYGETVETQPIIPKVKRKKVKPEEIGNFCRQALIQVKKELGKEAVGGENTLLFSKNYEHQLIYTCGLPAESGGLKYLKGQSLAGNVTADHYRPFSSPEGLHYLYGLISRNSQLEPIEEKVSWEMVDGQIVNKVRSLENGRFAKATGKLILPAGSPLELGAFFGVSGTINVTAQPKLSESREKASPAEVPTKMIKKKPDRRETDEIDDSEQLMMVEFE